MAKSEKLLKGRYYPTGLQKVFFFSPPQCMHAENEGFFVYQSVLFPKFCFH